LSQKPLKEEEEEEEKKKEWQRVNSNLSLFFFSSLSLSLSLESDENDRLTCGFFFFFSSEKYRYAAAFYSDDFGKSIQPTSSLHRKTFASLSLFYPKKNKSLRFVKRARLFVSLHTDFF
jgi:hypothetical protein